MRRHRAVMVVAGAAAVWCAAPLPVTAVPAARAAAQAGTWGTAIEVPGLGALNRGGAAQLNQVSCGAVGNCVAVGSYADGSFHVQAFLVSETNGTWRSAVEVPRSGTLNAGGFASADSVSCVSAGNCTAFGSYTDGTGRGQAFVISETGGNWGVAVKVPGVGGLNRFGFPIEHDSVSCASVGNCAAVGRYQDGASRFQVFVVSETNGTWGKAIKMPFSGILNWAGAAVDVGPVSCGAAGNCAAVGSYHARGPDSTQAFVVSMTNGTWDTAIEVPGSETLNTGKLASGDSVSCASAGNCTAVGSYRVGVLGCQSCRSQVFVVRETNGTWGQAIPIPGAGLFDAGSGAGVTSVSCASAGNCAAGGTYEDSALANQAFVVSETNGTWGDAIEVPGSGALNGGQLAIVGSVSCPSAGNCTAGGFYEDGSRPTSHEQPFVVSETNGTWGDAIQVPGSGTLNAGDAKVTSVSCRSAGRCAAGGTYTDASGHTQAFVVNQS